MKRWPARTGSGQSGPSSSFAAQSPAAAGITLALLIATLATPARAHVVSDLEVQVLQQLPAGMVAKLGQAVGPDSTGNAGANRGGWRRIEEQAGAMLLLADAASRADSLAAERAWRSLDAAFARQQPLGAFDAVMAASRADTLAEVLGTARWAGEVCRALIVVMNGPLQDRFRFRYALALPKLRRTLDWLAANEPALESAHPERATVLLTLAQTFLLADGTYHEESFAKIGQRCLVAGLALQREDGAFSDDGAITLAGQARAVSSLQEVAQYFPAPSLERAVDLAAARLVRQVDPHGAWRGASGPNAEADRRQATLVLAYHAERKDDAEARAAARRAFERITHPH